MGPPLQPIVGSFTSLSLLRGGRSPASSQERLLGPDGQCKYDGARLLSSLSIAAIVQTLENWRFW